MFVHCIVELQPLMLHHGFVCTLTFISTACETLTKPSSNILSLPFRKTHSIDLSEAIKQYISSKYDQHPSMFRQDLEVINNLRQDAINVKEPHASGAKKLSAYAAQLVWTGGKFPIDAKSPMS